MFRSEACLSAHSGSRQEVATVAAADTPSVKSDGYDTWKKVSHRSVCALCAPCFGHKLKCASLNKNVV